MTYKKFIIMAVLFILPALCISGLPEVYGNQEAASILYAENNVEIKRSDSGNREKATRGTEIFYGDKIITSDSGKAMLVFTDGTQMKLDSNTEIKLLEMEGNPAGPAGIIDLSAGTIWSLVRPAPEEGPPAMKINTPTSMCTIKGTEIAMAVSGTEGQNLTTTLTVISGEAELTNSLGKCLIPASCQSMAYANQPPAEPVSLTKKEIEEEISWIDFGNPRVMVIVEELNLGQINLVSELESEINMRLTEAHYHLIDAAQLEKIKESDEVKKAVMGDEIAAAALGKRLGYDVVVAGRVETIFISEEKTENQTISLCEARSDIKVIISDTAQILFTKKLSAEGQSLSKEAAGIKAMENISRLIADDLVWEIPAGYIKGEKGQRTTEVIIENCSFEERVTIIEYLKTIEGVEGKVFPRSFDNSIAVIDVEYEGTSEELVCEIIKIRGIKLEVTGLTMNKIQVNVIK